MDSLEDSNRILLWILWWILIGFSEGLVSGASPAPTPLKVQVLDLPGSKQPLASSGWTLSSAQEPTHLCARRWPPDPKPPIVSSPPKNSRSAWSPIVTSIG